MEIIVAKNSGFCFGVKKAYDKAHDFAVNKSAANGIVLNTYGELVHNRQVVEKLEKIGVKTVDDVGDATADTIVIRAHGVAPEVYEKIKAKDLNLIDATCEFVKYIQKGIDEYSNKGYKVVIIGDKNHPEVIGLCGYAKNGVIVVNTEDEANNLAEDDSSIFIVAQTTFNVDKYDVLLTILLRKFKNSLVKRTICSATTINQNSTKTLSKLVDAMVVIGGKHSSNTKKLYEISLQNCNNSFFIEKAEEINVKFFQKYGKIGIVAGASTPDWIIDEVVAMLKSKCEV